MIVACLEGSLAYHYWIYFQRLSSHPLDIYIPSPPFFTPENKKLSILFKKIFFHFSFLFGPHRRNQKIEPDDAGRMSGSSIRPPFPIDMQMLKNQKEKKRKKIFLLKRLSLFLSWRTWETSHGRLYPTPAVFYGQMEADVVPYATRPEGIFRH